MKRIRSLKRLVVDLPLRLRLAYCLMRDPRVPAYTKALFAGTLAIVVTPVIDLPVAIPVIGELDAIALTLLAVRVFIAACPGYVVAEQEQLILEQRSRFDDDLRNGERLAIALYRRFRHPDDVEVTGSRARQTSEAVPGASV